MSRRMLAILTPIAAVLILVAAGDAPAPVGAPWISLEVPANPMDPATRDAAFVVHTYYHENAARFPVSGTAEGIVNGERRTVDLEFTKTGRPGVYAVKQQWQSEGSWILAINLNMQGGSGLMVELGPNGGVVSDEYYEYGSKAVSLSSVRVVGGAIEPDQIDRRLRALATAAEE